MIEFVIVILIVAVAAYFTVRRLLKEARGGSCDSCGCSCGGDKSKFTEIAKPDLQKSGSFNQYRKPGERSRL